MNRKVYKCAAVIFLVVGTSIIANPFESRLPELVDLNTGRVPDVQEVTDEIPRYTGFLRIDQAYTAYVTYGKTTVRTRTGDVHPFGTVMRITETELHLQKNGIPQIIPYAQ